MTSPWPLEIDDQEYQPIPESWIEYGTDAGRGSPRVYAVSVAHDVRNLIRMRYATVDGRVFPVTTPKRENPTGEGYVPAKLATKHDWVRSLVPDRGVSSVDVLRGPETEHMHELWADRVDDLEDVVDQGEDGDDADRELVADGGSVASERYMTLGTVTERLDDENTVGIVDGFEPGPSTVTYSGVESTIRRYADGSAVGDSDTRIFVASDGGELSLDYGPQFDQAVVTNLTQAQLQTALAALAEASDSVVAGDFGVHFDHAGPIIFDGAVQVATTPVQFPWDFAAPDGPCGPTGPSIGGGSSGE